MTELQERIKEAWAASECEESAGLSRRARAQRVAEAVGCHLLTVLRVVDKEGQAPPKPTHIEARQITEHYTRKLIACPKCRRVRLDNQSRACLIKSLWGRTAYCRCRGCGHNFKVILEEMP